jgi:dienelactone hydrolase
MAKNEHLESVSVPADGVSLAGDLIIPAAARGLVLFAHGTGSSRHSPRNRFVAAELRKAGLATLLIDLLTEAEERVDERSAGSLRFDVGLLARRLRAASSWLLASPATADLPLGYFGASTGAAAALVAAAGPSGPVGAIVSRGGRPDLAGPALGSVRAPTLLIVGGSDDVVIPLNQRALEALQCEKRLEIVPGATHLFEETGALERVAELAAGWFREHLGARAARGRAGGSGREP